MPDFEHHRIDRDGVDLHAVSLGQGRPIVLIHGFPQHWWMWRGIMADVADRGFRAIAVDQRGMGGSSIPLSGYDKRTLGRDVAAVMEALETGPATVVGYDHGAGTALALAYEAPQRVARLAVLEYAPPGFGYEYGLTASPQNVNWQLAFFTQPDVAIAFLQGRERELLAWYFWHWSHDPDAVPQADFEVYVRQLQKPGGLRGGLMHFASVWEDLELFRAWAAAGRLAMPVLAVGGARGAGEFPAMAMQALADDVTPVVMQGAGHWLAEERSAALVALLANFAAATKTSA